MLLSPSQEQDDIKYLSDSENGCDGDLYTDSGRNQSPISALKYGVHVPPFLLPQPPFISLSI